MQKSAIVRDLYANNPDNPDFQGVLSEKHSRSLNKLGHVKGLADRRDFPDVIQFEE